MNEWMESYAVQCACSDGWIHYGPPMPTITEVEKLAFDLPETQRAVLAAHLLESLPSVLQDDDDGIAEALLRDADMNAHPEAGISLEQFDRQIARRRA